ncbi:hypothetical protein HZB94_01500 [Candidatus Falkowbacteria bacterium]|nr:hypothetical protein [Candidatus Falkowbacteria bacterium]
MKLSIKKVFIICSALVVLSQIFSLSYFVLVPAVFAADEGAPDITGAIIRVPFWDLPAELKTFSFEPCPEECKATDPSDVCQTKQSKTCLNIPWIAMYIGAAYRYAVVLGSILAVFMIMLGGVVYSLAGINQNMVKTGRDFISGAVIGLILLLGSYILLNTINPNFISLKPVKIEVVKEQGMIKELTCDEAEKQGYTVDTPNWKTNNTCGQEFDLKYAGSDTTKQVAGQKCTSTSCGNTGLACIKMVETGDYQCKSVLMYGEIIYPGFSTLLGCGQLKEAVATKGFYVDELMLKRFDIEGDSIGMTSIIPIGQNKFSYYIEKKDIVDMTGPNVSKLQPSDRVYLWISVNDADFGWLVATIDDDFIAAPSIKNYTGKNEVGPIAICNGNMYSASLDASNKKLTYFSISALTWDQLKSAPNGIHWDINITKDFFDCEGGATKDALKVDCDIAKNAGTGSKGEKGDVCKTNSDCKTESGLICNSVTGVCSVKGQTDALCSINGDCEVGYYCDKTGSKNVCELAGLEKMKCDPSNDSSCGAELICTDEDDFADQPICVQAPKACTDEEDNSDCKNVDGWLDGDCDGGSCDCDLDSDCDETKGYICAGNPTSLYNKNASCVLK